MANRKLFVVVLVGTVSVARISVGQAISGDEFTRISDRIMGTQAQIQSLQMSCIRSSDKDGKTTIRKSLYARSGEKEYCKTFWPTTSGEPDSTRYSLALWNGKALISYESRAHNGTLHAQRSKNPSDPQTYSDVCRYFGHLTEGSLQELLKRIPPEQWVATWTEPGKTLTVTCDAIPRVGSHERSEWLLEVSKGFMVSRYRISWQDPKDPSKYKQALEMNVTDSKEVLPGVWIPTRSHLEYRPPDMGNGQSNVMIVQDMRIDDVKVNDPTIEEAFTFTWPDGAQYYDYTLKCTVTPHATDKAMEQQMNKMAADMRSVATLPTEQRVDDTERSIPERPSTVSAQSHDTMQQNTAQSRSLFLCLVPVVIIAMVVVALMWFRHVHREPKGGRL